MLGIATNKEKVDVEQLLEANGKGTPSRVKNMIRRYIISSVIKEPKIKQ